jgi:hypothetical protein
MLSELYLIQGVFFQERQSLEVAHLPVEGAVAVVRDCLHHFMFAGILEVDPEKVLSGYRGAMQDYFGESQVSNGRLTEDTLYFTKKYQHRSDTIEYKLTKEDSRTWVGEYNGLVTGTGRVRCLLTPITSDFFRSPDLPPQAYVSQG